MVLRLVWKLAERYKEQKFVWLMSSEDSKVLKCFSKYQLEIYVKRTALLGYNLSGHWIVYYILFTVTVGCIYLLLYFITYFHVAKL